MECQGPCMRHCSCSPAVAVFAYLAFAWVVASALYVAATRCMGTPFRDSLTAEQEQKLEESCRARKMVFCASLLVAVVALGVAKPIRLPCSAA